LLNIGQLLLPIAIILYISAYLYLSYANGGINYFGGSHAVGNRYFYILPVFFYLIDMNFVKRNIVVSLVIVIVSLAFMAPVLSSPIESSTYPMEHTLCFPYKILPIEKTMLNALPLWLPSSFEFNRTEFIHLNEKSSAIIY
jgi:hypothetical protein